MESRKHGVPKPESILLRTFAKMSGNYSYDQLPAIHESQDIAECVLWKVTYLACTNWPNSVTDHSYDSQKTLRQRHSNSSSISYSPSYERMITDYSSCRSIDTVASTSSSGSNFAKLKNGWNRITRRTVPQSFQGSVRRQAAADIEPTRIKRGVWKDQLLIDRSLRGMAALTALFAFGVFIIIAVHIQPFAHRSNKNSSSIGGETRSCKDVTMTNTALLLLINVAATMVLGMSNTYQQLITSLTIGDLKMMLQKYGDSKVGTNSPFNINKKKDGRRKSWLAWLLLITTSLPVHFLANSLIGPSTILEPPAIIQYDEIQDARMPSYVPSDFDEDAPAQIIESGAFVCWSAFRTGQAHFPNSLVALTTDDSIYGAGSDNLGNAYSRMVVHYTVDNCTGLVNSTDNIAMVENELKYSAFDYGLNYFQDDCRMAYSVHCSLHDMGPVQCRLNVRMNALFVLFACLTIKAIYMIAVNLLARGKLKTHCLTFGDVLVASSSDPELRVQGCVFSICIRFSTLICL
jgi:hypothetical protein